PALARGLSDTLRAQGFDVHIAADGQRGLDMAASVKPDLILLDIMMPGRGGIEVCRELKADLSLPFMPVILVTAKADPDDIVAGLDAGGDEYITKPVDHAALVARVRSILRIKALHDQVQEQTAELEHWNRTLEERVSAQLAEIESLGALKRFVAPQVAELIIAAGDERLLESHRREITVVFCDLRGFTAFAETSEPEEVIGVLRQYHEALGELIFRYEGTLERFVGDGAVVLFNDPLPCPDPCARAVRMAIAMRENITALSEEWRKRGHDLGFGVGIAHGYATLGRIGFEGRFEYTAIGPVPNLASRLCDEAGDREILISQRALVAVEDLVEAEPLGELTLKGFVRPVPAWRILRLAGG
ncbi:MAG TPA: adenylate/guanylate cyclase domain-containing protein, partial [Geminicoccaceae bacterium]|nr:adenylate/guanylate cyclase domain-containing protein [Geminicoccaceae bacterium]